MNRHERDTLSSSNKAQQVAARFFPFQMMDVRIREIHANLYAPAEEEEPEPSIEFLIEADEPNTDEEFSVRLLFDAQHVSIEDERFNLSVILEGYFVPIVEPETIDQQVAQRFKTRDVVMVLWPYLREAVHNITQRMQIDMPLLPVITPQQLSSQEEEASE